MKKLKFRPNADFLEDRSLMSTFGGGNIDTTIPRVATTSPGLNFTSNSFHQINDTIPSVASSIIATPSSATSKLTSYVTNIPNGKASLLPILEADVATFERGTAKVTTTQATNVTNLLFTDLLHRAPTAAELSAVTASLQNGSSVTQVVDVLVRSNEFILDNMTAGASGNANQIQYVTALYNDVLGRAPDLPGLTGWLNEINFGGVSLPQVADGFVFSSEAATSSTSILQMGPSVTVNALYEDLLDRAPNTAELNAGTAALKGGATITQVVDVLATSNEFFVNNTTTGASGNANQVQYVTALYNDVLGRAPDLAGITGWLNAINYGGLSLTQVANGFVFSPEAATSSTSVIQKNTIPVVTTSYYYGTVAPNGSITGNFSGTSKTAQLENLIQKDTLAYLGNGIGKTFNILKSGVNFSSDSLLTYNGKV